MEDHNDHQKMLYTTYVGILIILTSWNLMEQLVVWSYEHYRWLYGNTLKYNSSSSTHVVVGVVNVLGDGGGGTVLTSSQSFVFFCSQLLFIKKIWHKYGIWTIYLMIRP